MSSGIPSITFLNGDSLIKITKHGFGLWVTVSEPHGHVNQWNIPSRIFPDLIDLIGDAPHLCRACKRPEDDCSADPCASVIADREA